MKYIISVDFGGSKIKAALLDIHGNIIKKIKTSTNAKKGKAAVLKKLMNLIGFTIEGFNKKDIQGIGIAVASPVDFNKQILVNPPNLPGWNNIKLSKIIQNKFKIKTIIENDVNCAALAESKFTKAKDIVVLTIGTGIGGGIIINNEIYRGNGYAGELGHIVIQENGPKCMCGNTGCLEVLASGTAIKKMSKKVFGKELLGAELAKMKDKRAKKILTDVGKHLGVGLTTIVHALNPEEIILAGGVKEAGNELLKSAVKEMKKRVFTDKKTIVRFSNLEDPVLIGGACLFLR